MPHWYAIKGYAILVAFWEKTMTLNCLAGGIIAHGPQLAQTRLQYRIVSGDRMMSENDCAVDTHRNTASLEKGAIRGKPHSCHRGRRRAANRFLNPRRITEGHEVTAGQAKRKVKLRSTLTRLDGGRFRQRSDCRAEPCGVQKVGKTGPALGPSPY